MRDTFVYRALQKKEEVPEEVRKQLNINLQEDLFDTRGRDRRNETPTNDLPGSSVSASLEARINVLEIDMYEPKDEYITELSKSDRTPLVGTFATTIQESLSASIAIAKPLIQLFTSPFDQDREFILWHGTTNKNVDNLLRTPPVLNPGAYGHGFYLTPHPGKADQYSARNEESDVFTCIIGFRCIPGVLVVNPHLDPEMQRKAEFEKYTSWITQSRSSDPVRFQEVIVRDPTRLSIFAVIKYDLYKERVGLPSPQCDNV